MIMSGKLDGSLCYLIGAMEDASDNGIEWRERVIGMSREAGLDIKYLDPTKKTPSLATAAEEDQKKISHLKSTNQWDALTKMMKPIVRVDHRCVDHCDFVIFYCDYKVHTCGSYFEFRGALAGKKPYFVIAPHGKKNIPSWLFGICDHNFFFESIKEVIDYLSELDSGNKIMSDRWVLYRKDIQEL